MKKHDSVRLLKRLRSGDERLLAELMTRIQNEPRQFSEFLGQVYRLCQTPEFAAVPVLGITGPPGAGKSTLLRSLLREMKDEKVGILLIDPSSPFSGGALLGDRLRMEEEIGPHHFVRSLGSRGERGGLTRAARDLVRLLVASGMSYVLVETVGVGQTETEIMDLADTTLVVVTPDHGDTVQTMKAGLLEIADLFVVNKADLPGADRMAADLEGLGGKIPVLRTIATRAQGVREVWQMLSVPKSPASAPRQGRERLAREVAQRLGSLYEQQAYEALMNSAGGQKSLDRIGRNQLDPYRLAEQLLRRGGS